MFSKRRRQCVAGAGTMSIITFPASGWCASCGVRVVESFDFGIYEPPAGTQGYLYLLCPPCAAVANGPACNDVLEAVEQRVHFGRGARA